VTLAINRTRQDIPGFSSLLTLKGEYTTVHAYLPIFPRLSGSCAIYFAKPSIEGCTIALNHDDILRRLFRGLYTTPELALRGFIIGSSGPKEEQIVVDLGNCRLSLSVSEVRDLCNIVDHMATEYLQALQTCEARFEIAKFREARTKDAVPLVQINRRLWLAMIKFTNEHDIAKGNSDWHIFDASHAMIKVFTNRQTSRFNRAYHAFLVPRQVPHALRSFTAPDDEVYVAWKLPITDLGTDNIQTLNERDIWDATTTHRWLVKEFIPYVLYYYSGQRKKMSFKVFASEMDIEKDISMMTLDSYPSPDTIEDITGLRRLAEFMQGFFNVHSSNASEFSVEEMRGLYEALHLALIHSTLDEGALSYIQGHLPFQRMESGLGVLQSITKPGEMSYFQIDLALRCLGTAIQSSACRLNRHEIKEIALALSSFLVVVEREELIERNAHWSERHN
jgi:hypothetical protein